MFAYIKGKLVEKNPTYVVIETSGGVGYHINISLHTYSKIDTVDSLTLLTYLHIREDAHLLFGFFDDLERQLFLQLISVSGVGTSSAQMMLSSMLPSEIQQSIVNENVSLLKTIKGIGEKTAKKIILELKDKLTKTIDPTSINMPVLNTFKEEALNALCALGIAKAEAQKALNRVLKVNPDVSSVEALIKEALKSM